METTPHTPTPWKYSIADEAIMSVGNVQMMICEAPGTRHRGPYGEYGPAEEAFYKTNAEFICRACNSHEALVAALEAILDAIEYDDNGDAVLAHTPWDGVGDPPDISEPKCILAASAALALARKEA